MLSRLRFGRGVLAFIIAVSAFGAVGAGRVVDSAGLPPVLHDRELSATEAASQSAMGAAAPKDETIGPKASGESGDFVFAPTASESPWLEVIGPGFLRYVPGTDEWDVPCYAVGEWVGTAPSLVGVALSVDGGLVPVENLAYTPREPTSAAGRIGARDVLRLKMAVAADLVDSEASGLDWREAVWQNAAAAALEGVLTAAEPTVISLVGASTLSEGAHWLRVTFRYSVGDQVIETSDTVEVLSTTLPTIQAWYPADLHLHSTLSDGGATIAERQSQLKAAGYSIGYLTDHTGSLMETQAFASMGSEYPTACEMASDSGTCLFPGIEIMVPPSLHPLFWDSGHCLGYGVTSTSGLDDLHWFGQTALDHIRANNPPLSNSSIAHPSHPLYAWRSKAVLGCSGMELMSGTQLRFGRTCAPVETWLESCQKCAFCSSSFRLSVRTGSDSHGESLSHPYVTYVGLPSSSLWDGASWLDKWEAVSQALKDGRTVASRKGSFVNLQADGHPMGDTIDANVGQTVTFNVHFGAVEVGKYRVRVYEDASDTAIGDSGDFQGSTGVCYDWQYEVKAKTGTHFYWACVSGADDCYTTPIYITGNQTSASTISFAAGPRMSVPYFAFDVEVGDLKADGAVDLAVASWDADDGSGRYYTDMACVSTFFGRGDGKFETGPVHGGLWCTEECGLGDVNGDRFTDIVVGDLDYNYLTAILNDGSGREADRDYFTVGDYPVNERVTDVNGDGISDIVSLSFYGQITVLLGKEGGGYSPAQTYWAGLYSYSYNYAMGDLNRDQYPDIAVGDRNNGRVYVLLNDGTGGFPTSSSYSTSGHAMNGLAIADLNGDGWGDIAATSYDTWSLSILFNDGAGAFSEDASYYCGNRTWNVAAADFDNDGDQDLAVVNLWNWELEILRNNGDGSFSWVASYPTGENPCAVRVADFNGDGKPDLAVSECRGYAVSVFFNTSDYGGMTPVAPTKLKAAPSYDGAQLSWDVASKGVPPTGFVVMASRTSGGPYVEVKDARTWVCEVTSDDYAFTPGQKLFFQVKSYVEMRNGFRIYSKPTSTVSTLAGPVPPSPPRSLKARPGMRGIHLTWLPPTNGLLPSGYRVAIGPSSKGQFTVIADTEHWGGNPWYDITTAEYAGLVQGGVYSVQVWPYVRDVHGNMVLGLKPAAISAIWGPAELRAPGKLKAVPSNVGVSLTWSAPTKGAFPDGYRIGVSDSSGGTFIDILDIPTEGQDDLGVQVDAVTLDAAVGYDRITTYYFRVCSIGGAAGDGLSVSPGVVAKSLAGPVPLPPTGLRATPWLGGGLRLDWKAPKGNPVDGYDVWAAPELAPGLLTRVALVTEWDGENPSLIVTADDLARVGLPYSAGTSYRFQVYSFICDPLDGVTPVDSAKFAKVSARMF